MTVLLRARNLTRTYSSAAGDVHACVDVSLEVSAGELVVVRGPSGAGKSTLLNLLGTLDKPTSGTIEIDGQEVTALAEDALAVIRRDNLGFIFQSFGLVSILSAAENVELPLRIAGVAAAERVERVDEALARVGLEKHAEQRPSELSGGQQQRVGIARAIVSRPHILIADEPTGQLDSRTAASIMDLLSVLAHEQGLAAIVSTHDPLLVARADRVIDIHDGRITAVHDAKALASEPSAEPQTESAEQAAAVPAAGLEEQPEVPATPPLTRKALKIQRAMTGEIPIIRFADADGGSEKPAGESTHGG
ncbi:ABC transporter ATP-binding protein [Microbacterium sp. NC79]|uniref:ABC transporter ATP-binding protein n=1 Tax=Microbacterium sp. NC79 TaxID=2851009 RepID=UPI001C2B814B|nr:ABC transporter ATP-binding protein [Microbacterium sp. NC79]MBV0895824.1 ABC transporter ATP-binding protein [Microbacterium sp. NC79]